MLAPGHMGEPKFLFMPFLGTCLHTGQTIGRLFMLNRLERRGLTQGCTFWSSVDIASQVGGKMHQNTSFGVLIVVFKPPNMSRIETFTYCINCNQTLHGDKDHKVLFIGGRNTCQTNQDAG